jgi:hypothetical protein
MVPVSQAVRWVQGEYQELPRLSLTRSQVRRLWGLDELTCDAVLDALVRADFLAATTDGRYVRRHLDPPRRSFRRRAA